MKNQSDIFVSTEQLQWIVFAHFTLNETGKTLNGLNGSRVEDRGEGGGGYSWHRWHRPMGSPASAMSQCPSVLSDATEGHNIHIATRGIYDPSELDIIFVEFSYLMHAN